MQAVSVTAFSLRLLPSRFFFFFVLGSPFAGLNLLLRESEKKTHTSVNFRGLITFRSSFQQICQ